MHFAVDLSVIQSFLERKREESSTDDDECTSNDDDYDSESTSTSGSGFKRGDLNHNLSRESGVVLVLVTIFSSVP